MSKLKPGWLRRQIDVTVAKRKFMDGAEAIFNEQVLPIIADPLPKDGAADELAAVVSDLHKVQGELDVAEASAARLRKAVEDAKTVLKAVRVDMSLTPDDRRRKVDGVIDTLTAALQPETGTGATAQVVDEPPISNCTFEQVSGPVYVGETKASPAPTDGKEFLMSKVREYVDTWYEYDTAAMLHKVGLEAFVDYLIESGYTSSVPPEYRAHGFASEKLAQDEAQPTRGDDPDPVTPGKDEQSPP